MIAAVVTGLDTAWVPDNIGATVYTTTLGDQDVLYVEVADEHLRALYDAARSLGGRYVGCDYASDLLVSLFGGRHPADVLVRRDTLQAAMDQRRSAGSSDTHDARDAVVTQLAQQAGLE